MNHTIPVALLSLTIPLVAVPTVDAGGLATIAREAFEYATRRSGREFVEQAARESGERSVEAAMRKHGPKAAGAIADGGLELIEASAQHGDDVIRLALEAGPEARRAVALDAANLVPLARELGPEAVELEAKSPGLARRVIDTFGVDDARRITRTVPAEDLPRLVAYADAADTPQTRKLLLEAYEKEGPSLFERIPATFVLSGGVSSALIYGTHRLTAPFAATGARIANDPQLGKRVVDRAAQMVGAVMVIVTVACLYRFGVLRGPTTAEPAAQNSRTAS